MRLYGNRIHGFIGLWVLAGLMVLGANGYMLMTLFDEPLTGLSEHVRHADRAFRQYRSLLEAKSVNRSSGMQTLANWFAPAAVNEDKPVAETPSEAPLVVKQATVPPAALPGLTGIITRQSTDGSIRRLALINGQVCIEGDRLQDFTIARIDSGGVYLANGDRTWFIKTPDIDYTRSAQ
jgi:hypothetical protein